MSRNRNQRRNINEPRKASSSKPLFNLGTDKIEATVVKNSIKEVEEILRKALEKPLEALMAAGSGIATVLGSISLFSSDNDSSSSSGATFGLLDGMLNFLPGRIMAFFVLTMSLGWFISIVGIWLTSRPSDVRNILAHTATAFGAILLALSIESIFSQDIKQQPFLFLFLGIAGATAAIYIVKTNFKLNSETSMNVIAVRASLLANFSCLTAALVVFSQVSGLSL